MDRAIGIFDSGLGGLSVVRAVANLLPNEDILYFADFRNFPYGQRPPGEVEKLVTAAAQFFLKNCVKVIVLACNTASVLGTDAAKTVAGEIPVVNMVGPTVRTTLRLQNLRRIGVIGTTGTITSRVYESEFMRCCPTVEVFGRVCDGLLNFLGEGDLDNEVKLKSLVKKCLHPFEKSKIDAIVLGCTDLTCIARQLRQALTPSIHIIDPVDEVAATVNELLQTMGLRARKLRPGAFSFYATGQAPSFTSKFALKAFNISINRIHSVEDF